MTKETESLTANMEPDIEIIPTSMTQGTLGDRSDADIIRDINAVLDAVGIPEKITGIIVAEEHPEVSLSYVLPEDKNTGSNTYLKEFFDFYDQYGCYLFNPNTFEKIDEGDYFMAVATSMNVLYRHQKCQDPIAIFEQLFVLNSETKSKVVPIAENCLAAWKGIMALYALRKNTDPKTFDSVLPDIFELQSITLY
jgi:hypothetical protein